MAPGCVGRSATPSLGPAISLSGSACTERAKDDARTSANERQLRKWREAMVNYPALINRCSELEAGRSRAIIRCGLGWDGERITFTISKKLKSA